MSDIYEYTHYQIVRRTDGLYDYCEVIENNRGELVAKCKTVLQGIETLDALAEEIDTMREDLDAFPVIGEEEMYEEIGNEYDSYSNVVPVDRYFSRQSRFKDSDFDID